MKQPRETKQFWESQNTDPTTQRQQEKKTEKRQHIKRSGKYTPLTNSYQFNSFGDIFTLGSRWSKKTSQSIFKQISRVNFFQFLATASIIMAVFILLTEADERKEQAIYEAWKVANSDKNELPGVTILALERLNKEKFSLSGIDAANTDLRGINLIGANLSKINFRKANLTKANLTRVNLLAADLKKIQLNSADLKESLLMEANLEEANLAVTNLKKADLWRTNLVKADLTGADLTGADLTGADLTGANLTNAQLENVSLRGANLTGANLTGANLTNAQLKGAKLDSANLKASNVAQINLSKSNLFTFNSNTVFPKNFRPESRGIIESKSISQKERLIDRAVVWWGFITDSQRNKTELRYEVTIKDGSLEIVLAPYGQSPLQMENIDFSGTELLFSWPRAEPLKCELRRQPYSRYVGQCLNTQNQTLNMRMASSFRERPLKGRKLAPSKIDLQILQRALEILHDESVWHQEDERICDDDKKQDSWSLFCALYNASLQVDSKYHHQRPAMKEARDVIREITNNSQFVALA